MKHFIYILIFLFCGALVFGQSGRVVRGDSAIVIKDDTLTNVGTIRQGATQPGTYIRDGNIAGGSEQRLRYDYTVDSIEQILQIKANTGERIEVKTGEEYEVKHSPINGYVTDSVAVIPLKSSNYAVLQPQNNELNVDWFGAKPDDDKDDGAIIQKAFAFAFHTGNQSVVTATPSGRYLIDTTYAPTLVSLTHGAKADFKNATLFIPGYYATDTVDYKIFFISLKDSIQLKNIRFVSQNIHPANSWFLNGQDTRHDIQQTSNIIAIDFNSDPAGSNNCVLENITIDSMYFGMRIGGKDHLIRNFFTNEVIQGLRAFNTTNLLAEHARFVIDTLNPDVQGPRPTYFINNINCTYNDFTFIGRWHTILQCVVNNPVQADTLSGVFNNWRMINTGSAAIKSGNWKLNNWYVETPDHREQRGIFLGLESTSVFIEVQNLTVFNSPNARYHPRLDIFGNNIIIDGLVSRNGLEIRNTGTNHDNVYIKNATIEFPYKTDGTNLAVFDFSLGNPTITNNIHLSNIDILLGNNNRNNPRLIRTNTRNLYVDNFRVRTEDGENPDIRNFILQTGDPEIEITNSNLSELNYLFMIDDSGSEGMDSSNVKINNVIDENGVAITTIPVDIRNTVSSFSQDSGSISDTTDGSGDIIVTHTLGTSSFIAKPQVTGTTNYNVLIHDKTTTTFKVRFINSTNDTPITSTAVTFDWTATKQ